MKRLKKKKIHEKIFKKPVRSKKFEFINNISLDGIQFAVWDDRCTSEFLHLFIALGSCD